MYNEVMGFGSSELVSEFDRRGCEYVEEYQLGLGEAPIERPYEFCGMVKQSNGEEKKIMDFKTGTTTLAFVFKEGVIMAVDSRATMGNFISSETVRKVIEISPRKLATIAGGAADCQYWEAWLSQEVRMFELRHGKEPSTAAASRMMVNLINHYKRYGLSMGLMLSGVDENGPNLYYINTEGSRIKGDLFSVGSGMTYAYGVLDTFYRYDMTLEEAVELGTTSPTQVARLSTTPPTETRAAAVWSAFTTSTRTAGLRKSQEMTSTNCTTSTSPRRDSPPTTPAASCDRVILQDKMAEGVGAGGYRGGGYRLLGGLVGVYIS